MITHIKVENFKSLRSTELSLGNLNLFIGTNASGKSNFFDALRVLQGVAYGFTIDEILNGKPKSANSEVWEPIRGGSAKAVFARSGMGLSNQAEAVTRFSVTMCPPDRHGQEIKYAIGVSPRLGCVRSEKLSAGGNVIYDSEFMENPISSPVFEVRYRWGKQSHPPHLQFEKSRPVLHQLLARDECNKSHRETIRSCIRGLSNMQRIDPIPAVLREYSHAQMVRRMGEHGENFAALVSTIIEDAGAKSAYLSWLKQLTPSELDDVAVLPGALQEPLFALKESGVDYPAPILSDGTLRFAAIAAAFFQPDMPDILTIEEIENAIHPTRLRLLVELLRSQSGPSRQVMATTHSPIVLAWLKVEDYSHTFVCKRDGATGESIIRPLPGVPGFEESVRKQPISDLFAEGWLETAL